MLGKIIHMILIHMILKLATGCISVIGIVEYPLEFGTDRVR